MRDEQTVITEDIRTLNGTGPIVYEHLVLEPLLPVLQRNYNLACNTYIHPQQYSAEYLFVKCSPFHRCFERTLRNQYMFMVSTPATIRM